MANKARGEIGVRLNGVDYTLRPSFSALCELEDRAGLTFLELAQRIAEQKISVKLVPSIIYAGIIGAGQEADFDEIADACIDEGFLNLMPACMAFMENAVKGGPKGAVKKK